ncbi:MAG: DUF4430 domain-containing protein [Oscillospiraceae bacterium]|nr:DUF4430 domain-containing protein [Oscillospiraceae bacterium]
MFAILNEIDGLEIESESTPYGAFISAINGEEQGDNYFWLYYVNGDFATVGVENYTVQDNDRIEFRLESFE